MGDLRIFIRGFFENQYDAALSILLAGRIIGTFTILVFAVKKMSISVQLNDEQSRRLEEIARELNVDPCELAKAAINDLVSKSSDDFQRAARQVLEKNRELYRRLS